MGEEDPATAVLLLTMESSSDGRNKIQRFGFGMLRATVAFAIVNWCCVLVAHASIL